MPGETQVVISVAFTLTAGAQAKKHRVQLIEWLQAHGFHDISEGRATLSARIGPAGFSRLFKIEAEPAEARLPSPGDAGRSGGWTVPDDLLVPQEIADYVKAVAVMPPATRFGAGEV